MNALLPLFLVACATRQETTDLDARVKALEEKIATMEGGAKPTAAKVKAETPTPSPEDAAATQLMKDAQLAIAAADFAAARAKLDELVKTYPTSRAAKAATRISAELAIIGTPAPELVVDKWFQGKATFAGNKATLIIFWEQWCPHCKEEMPKMQSLAEKWKDSLNVIGMTKVTKTATDELVMQYLQEQKIQFPIGKEKEGSMSKAFAISGVPAAAIVKGGQIIWRGHPNKLTDEFLTKLLGS
jgi:thiol-disulfide isomerase/thioredoxin